MVNRGDDDPRGIDAAGVPAIRDDDKCRYTTARRYSCSTHRDKDSEVPIHKCEKTVQLLRHCSGRPAEVVESKTEYTEGDVPSEMLRGSRVDERLRNEEWEGRFLEDWPPMPLDDGNRILSRSLFGGFEDLVHAAEELAQEFVGQFGHADGQSSRRARSFFEGFPRDQETRKDDFPTSNANDKAPNFSDYSEGFEEV